MPLGKGGGVGQGAGGQPSANSDSARRTRSRHSTNQPHDSMCGDGGPAASAIVPPRARTSRNAPAGQKLSRPRRRDGAQSSQHVFTARNSSPHMIMGRPKKPTASATKTMRVHCWSLHISPFQKRPDMVRGGTPRPQMATLGEHESPALILSVLPGEAR